MTVRHSNQTEVEGIHQPFNWIFADATERNAETGMTADDINKIALQEDTSTSYILTDLAPTWEVLTSGGGYPFDIISVDASDPDADYSDMSSAIAAASSGDLIVVGPGTYTCDAETVPAGVALIGQGAGVTILQTTSATRTLTTSGYILNISVIGNVASGEIHALTLNDGAEARGVVGDATSGGNSDTVRGIHVTGSASLWQCEGYADGGTFSFGLYGNGYQDACYVYGGRFSGINGTSDNGDIQDGDEQWFRLEYPIAVNGNVDVVNGSGWYLDESANMAQASISSGASPYVGADRILDEDTMTSDSDTALATQQSIKAYVDASVGSAGNYPFNIISVDVTDPDADYSDIASAVAAAPSGSVIVIGPGLYTVADLNLASKDLTFVGQNAHGLDDNQRTTIEGGTVTTSLFDGGNHVIFRNVLINGKTDRDVFSDIGTMQLVNCAVIVTSNSGTNYIVSGSTGGSLRIYSGTMFGNGTATTSVIDGSSTEVELVGLPRIDSDLTVSGSLLQGFYLDWDIGGNTAHLTGASAGVGVDRILDEDNMTSDSAEALATQQSIKAYADGKVDKSGDTMAGSLSLGGNELQNFTEQIVTATTGASYDIDWAAATLFELTLDNSPTITFSNLASGRSITLVLIQAGGGSQTISWPASVDWPGGTAPTLSTTAGAVDVLTMFVRNDGTTVLGFEAGLDMQ